MVVDVSTTDGEEPAMALGKLALRGSHWAQMMAKTYGIIIPCKINTHRSK
jgi:hypothetical protein